MASFKIECSPNSQDLAKIIRDYTLQNFALTSRIIHINPQGEIRECQVREDGKNSPFTFRFASMTKALTTFSILDLAEQQAIELNSPILDFFPEVNQHVLRDPRATHITTLHLLSHSSGLGGIWGADNMLSRGEKPWCPHNFEHFEHIRLAGNPGSNYLYSNIAYCLLGEIIARKTGTTYREHIQKNYLKNYDSLHFTSGKLLTEEAPYDLSNDYRTDKTYLSWFDFHALSSSAGLAGDPLQFAQLMHELHNKNVHRIFSGADDSICFKVDDLNCYSYTFKLPPAKKLKLAYQEGYMPGASSLLALNDQGDIVVWVAAGAPFDHAEKKQLNASIFELLE